MTNMCPGNQFQNHSQLPQSGDASQLLVDKRGAGRLLNVCVRQIDTLRKHGLPWVKLGGRIMFFKQSLVGWAKSHETNSLMPNDVSREREAGISSSDTFQNPRSDSEGNGGNDE